LRETWHEVRDPLAALQAGNRAPFEAFVHAEFTTFLGFFLRLGARRPEAEDLTQDLFLKLFRHAESYTARERFAAYAFRVARNAWIDRQRRNARADSAVEAHARDQEVRREGNEAEPAVPILDLARREEAARAREFLRELPEHHRLVIELGVVQELPYADIAAALDIPIGTVKSRMFHAVRRLREALESEASRPRLEAKRA
jgi:RNA polymerase sigma-70 factor (ECF subfamily)